MGTPIISIRQAVEQDAEGIARVHVLTWKSQYRGILPDSFLDRLTIESRLPGWKQRLAAPDPHGITLVAVISDEIVGFCSSGAERNAGLADTGEVYGLYVLAEHQGHGVGRDLLRQAASELRRSGYQSLIIWALKANPACGFYLRMGGQARMEKWFELEGERFPETGFFWQNIDQLIERPAE